MKLRKNREKPERDPLKRPQPSVSPSYTPASADLINHLRHSAARAFNFVHGTAEVGVTNVNGYSIRFLEDGENDTAVIDRRSKPAIGERLLISRHLGEWAITRQVYAPSLETEGFGTVTVRTQYYPLSGDMPISQSWDTACLLADGTLDMQRSLGAEIGLPIGRYSAEGLDAELDAVVTDRQPAA
jgi:hypothetical protein